MGFSLACHQPASTDVEVYDEAAQAQASRPPAPPAADLPDSMAWDILEAMKLRERRGHRSDVCCLQAERRARTVDDLAELSRRLDIGGAALHVAVAALDRRLGAEEAGGPELSETALHLLATTCLKVADVFCEQSKEYYKQENVAEYVEATRQRISAQTLLSCEKSLLPSLDFELFLPTTAWFLQCYLAYGRPASGGSTARISSFLGDLSLLDSELLAHPPSLRALCALAVGSYMAHHQRTNVPLEGAAVPPALRCWIQHVRDQACADVPLINAEMCLKAMIRMIVDKRRMWKASLLVAIERRHESTVNALVYPDRFPMQVLLSCVVSRAEHRVSAAAS